MRQLPQPPSANERTLAQLYIEQLTGLASATVTLSYAVAQTQDGVPLVLLFKNGGLLQLGAGASQYTVTGSAITLGTAAIAGDTFTIYYSYRI